MNNKGDLLSPLHIDRNSRFAKSSAALWLGIIIAAALIISFVFWLVHEPAPLPVKVQMARMATVDSSSASVLDATGYVVARRLATVSSKVTGKVVDVLVEEGMAVQKNQVLARLDDQNAKKAIDVIKAEVSAATADVKEVRARLVEAKLNYQRNNSLIEKKLVSAAAFDISKASYESLKAQLSNREELVAVKESLLAEQKQLLDDLTIRAPFAGVVISKDAQPGEVISPLSAGDGFIRTGICTLVDMDSLEVEVNVKESFVQRVHAGQAAEAVLDSYPEWKIPAKIAAIIPTADRKTATVKVRISFENLDPRILPDMGVKVAFLNPEPPEPETVKPQEPLGIRVPISAVRSVERNKFIFVIKNGVAEERRVKINASYGSDVYISEGLNAGEDFVVEVSPELKNDMKVIQE